MVDDRLESLIRRVRGLPQNAIPALERTILALENGAISISTSVDAPARAANELSWPHAPTHRIGEKGTFLVTAGTYQKRHFFRAPQRLDLLQDALLGEAVKYGWHLEAWAIFSNHYHFVAHSQRDPTNLKTFLGHLHTATAIAINKLDDAPARQVWHNFWETQLTFERSYLVRLNYVHQNAVKHKLVRVANQYPWCSAAWFERTATPAQVRTIYSLKTDRVNVIDDF